MKRRTFLGGVAAAGAWAALPCSKPGRASLDRQAERLDLDWRFFRGDQDGGAAPGLDDSGWEPATLPHTARVEHLVIGPVGSETGQWQGTCWYRRRLVIEAGPDELVFLRFEGAMNVAEAFLDGERIGGHQGGYLPFVLDLTDRLRGRPEHLLAVRLDNRDNPVTGPKPLEQLDFNMYHGLYRPVYLVRRNRLHITDPIQAGRTAGGGVFVTYPAVSESMARVRVQVHVRNAFAERQECRVAVALADPSGAVVARGTAPALTLGPGEDRHVVVELDVESPRLWSPASPTLHTLSVELQSGDSITDRETLRVGIRRFSVRPDGIRINGERIFLRGANRHQEYPYIGYALSDAAQYRDARKIKEAGFDYVRLSHYPHAPAFMDACDELGLVVMDCIPGWQYFNPDPAFVELQYQNCRDLVRRDRNHPCVILWEVSLNESGMTPEFVARTHAIAHEEYPGDQCYTAGWMDGYDVKLEARQHAGCRQPGETPCLVSEYGDWEYYAMNAGLDQGAWADLSPAESNSRQLRWQGERALLQQATNFQEAHNDNLKTRAVADGLWVMFDYNRGYAPDIESSGCMDIFRLPKYSCYFYRSQRDPGERGPMVFIASEWAEGSAPAVRVFSNCEEVALYLDGRLVGRQGPDRDRLSTHLRHPPFTFDTGGFRPGQLRAVAMLGGREVAEHVVRTPEEAHGLVLELDLSHRALDRRHKDTLLAWASLTDRHGTVLPGAWHNVVFAVRGTARLAGLNPIATEAGIAGIVVERDPGPGGFALYAMALVPGAGDPRLFTASLGVDHPVSAPAAGYQAGVATLRVEGQVLATLDASEPLFRVPVSAPPDKRGEFHR